MQDIEDRVLSRFKWGLSAELQAPDFEMRRTILKKILYRDGTQMRDEVVEYIAENVKTNVRELEGVVNSLVAESLFNRREITLELAKKSVEKIVKMSKKVITAELIQNEILSYFQISKEDLQSKSRKRHVVQARQLGMYFAKTMATKPLGLKVIGEVFGKRDHATVLHACRTVENLIQTDKQFQRYVADLTKKLNQ